MPKDKSRLTDYEVYQAELQRAMEREIESNIATITQDTPEEFRARISKEEAMNPLTNGNIPEEADKVKTAETVLCELLDHIVERLPSAGPDVTDALTEMHTRDLLKAFIDMVEEGQ